VDKSPFKEELELAQEAAELRTLVGMSELTRVFAFLPPEVAEVIIDAITYVSKPVDLSKIKVRRK